MEVEDQQFILQTYGGVAKDGRVVWKHVGFYENMGSLVKDIVRTKLAKRNETVSMDQFVVEYRKEVGRVEKMFEGIGK